MASAATPAQPASAPPGARTTTGGDVHVPRPAGRCAASGRVIEPGEKFVAAVRETPAGLERVDVAAEHWDAFDRAGLLAFWHTTMPRHEQKRKTFVDDAVLCDLFERLGEATEPLKVNFRFVLGLILMRKRLVVYDETRHEQTDAGPRDVWVVRLKGREAKMDLVDPKLDEQQVAEVSGQLGDILNQEM